MCAKLLIAGGSICIAARVLCRPSAIAIAIGSVPVWQTKLWPTTDSKGNPKTTTVTTAHVHACYGGDPLCVSPGLRHAGVALSHLCVSPARAQQRARHPRDARWCATMAARGEGRPAWLQVKLKSQQPQLKARCCADKGFAFSDQSM